MEKVSIDNVTSYNEYVTRCINGLKRFIDDFNGSAYAIYDIVRCLNKDNVYYWKNDHVFIDSFNLLSTALDMLIFDLESIKNNKNESC